VTCPDDTGLRQRSRARADQQHDEVGTACAHPGQRVEQQLMTLVRMEPGNLQQNGRSRRDRKATPESGTFLGIARKVFGVRAVADLPPLECAQVLVHAARLRRVRNRRAGTQHVSHQPQTRVRRHALATGRQDVANVPQHRHTWRRQDAGGRTPGIQPPVHQIGAARAERAGPLDRNTCVTTAPLERAARAQYRNPVADTPPGQPGGNPHQSVFRAAWLQRVDHVQHFHEPPSAASITPRKASTHGLIEKRSRARRRPA
jgi:hypothetical protein